MVIHDTSDGGTKSLVQYCLLNLLRYFESGCQIRIRLSVNVPRMLILLMIPMLVQILREQLADVSLAEVVDDASQPG